MIFDHLHFLSDYGLGVGVGVGITISTYEGAGTDCKNSVLFDFRQ